MNMFDTELRSIAITENVFIVYESATPPHNRVGGII